MADTTETARIRERVPYRTILTAIWLTIASAALLGLVVQLKRVIFHIVLAAFLAMVVTPPIAFLQRKVHMRRGRAIAVVVITAFIGVLGIGALVATPLASQAVDFAQHAGDYLTAAQNCDPHTTADCGPLYRAARRLHLEKKLAEAAPAISKKLSALSSQLIDLGRRLASAAFTAFIVAILAIFMLVEAPRMISGFMAGIPPSYREGLRRIGATTSQVVAGYTTGVLFMAFLNGFVAGMAMWATGTKFALPLAVWAGVVDILPIVGGLFAVIPAGLFAFIHSTTAGIVVIAAILIYQQIKNHLLYPLIVGRAVQLNSLLVLVAVLAGAELGHISGAVLAIPAAGALQAVFVEIGRFRAARRGEALTEVPEQTSNPGRVKRLWERYRTPRK